MVHVIVPDRPAPAPAGPTARALVLAALAVAALTVAVFGRAVGNDFVHYDDATYVTENPHVADGLTREGMRWAFTTGHASNWHPLTWLSHMLDVELFGLEPWGHHLTNVLLHALAAALLCVALGLMTGRLGTSFFVAALFALHPLRVESVAWVAERKDVLSAVFWMLTLVAYALHARRPGARRYLFVLVAFALGLLAKPMLVTLPLVLLLLDVWPLDRLRSKKGADSIAARWRPLVMEKVPLLVLAALVGLVTVLVQRAGGAVGDLEVIPLGARLANALVSGIAYVGMTVWPTGLAVFYPHPAVVAPGELMALTGPALLGGVVLVGFTAIVVRVRAAAPWAAVGWFWYLLTLLPVVGILQVGMQARADRYTYLSTVGIYLVVVETIRRLARARPALRRVLPAAAVLVLAACAGGTWRQIAHWRNPETLFTRAIDVTARNYIAHLNLGNTLAEQGNEDEAAVHYEKALEFYPSLPEAHVGLASVLHRRGERRRAIDHYLEAIRLRPDLVDAYVSLSSALIAEGEYAAARDTLERALARTKTHAGVHNQLGYAYEKLDDQDRALGHYREAIRLAPQFIEARKNAGFLYVQRGELLEAKHQFEEVLTIVPNDGDAHNNLGVTLHRLGDPRGAVAHYRRAMQAGQAQASTANNLAWILATCAFPDVRNGVEARRLATECVRQSEERDPTPLRTLAAACAASGEFEAAIEWQGKAIALAPEEWRAELRADLELFRAGRALKK